MRKTGFIFWSLFVAIVTQAAPAPQVPPKFMKGAQITIVHYDRGSRAFLVKVNEYPALGPYYAEPESVAQAMGFDGPTKTFIKNPKRFEGTVILLKHDLTILTMDQLHQREKQFTRK